MGPALAVRAKNVFGDSIGNVTIHTDAAAAAANRQLAARAFTSGTDIYFGQGMYQPDTNEGRRLIGHELTHVLQQRRGLASTATGDLNDPYETEADRGGAAFENGSPFPIASPAGSGATPQRAPDDTQATSGTETGPADSSSSTGAAATSNAEPSAAPVATADSPNGLPFLGEANTPDELSTLMADLATAEGVAQLGLVSEEVAFSGSPDVASHDSPSAPSTADTPDAAADSTTAPPIAQAWSLRRPIQRAVVAGCQIPGPTYGAIGIIAHRQIQSGCATTAPGCAGEVTIPGDGRADLVRQRIPAVPEIGEIKPASWLGRGLQPVAAAQLAGYIAAWTAAYGQIPVPMWSYAFTPGLFWGNPTQVLTAWGPASGLYFYRCLTPRPRRVRVPVRVPVPVPVVTPAPQSNAARNVATGVVATGAAIGVGYLIYRGVRLVPSLFPPLWPTIPANLAIP